MTGITIENKKTFKPDQDIKPCTEKLCIYSFKQPFNPSRSHTRRIT